MKGLLGCAVAFGIFVVFVGVSAAVSIKAGLATLGVLLLVTFFVMGRHQAKVAEDHRLEREAVRARELAEHQAWMAAREGELEARRQALHARYGTEIARAIIAGRYWQGATMEMIRDSLGGPADIREKVYKSKTKTTFCYRPIDARRFELKVHFEDGLVVGWDD